MNEGDENLFFEKENGTQEPNITAPTSHLKTAASVAALVVLALGCGAALSPILFPSLTQPVRVEEPAPEQAATPQTQTDVAALQARIKALEERTEAPATTAQPSANHADLEALQAGLAGLSTTLIKMQDQLASASQKADHAGSLAENALASTIAYVQMHTAAFAGRPFESEREAMRSVMSADEQGVALLNHLEGLAKTGAPSIDLLQKEFMRLAPDAQAALRRASAHTWQDRLVVALENLVTIRKLGSAFVEPLSQTAVSLDLSRDKLLDARAKTDAYPEEAKIVLQDWRKLLDQRIELEQSFSALSSHMMGRYSAPPSTNGEAGNPQ